MNSLLRSDAIDDELHGRLINWGNWLRYDPTAVRLGYPTRCPFVFSPTRGTLVADQDAQHLEYIISTMATSKFNLPDGDPLANNLELYAFILKVEYAEKPTGMMGPVGDRAKDVSRRFRRRCGERTYYSHLYRARLAVAQFVEPIK